MERAENKALTDVISGKPGESAPATNIVPDDHKGRSHDRHRVGVATSAAVFAD